jgi:hypothetical protein
MFLNRAIYSRGGYPISMVEFKYKKFQISSIKQLITKSIEEGYGNWIQIPQSGD